MPRTPSSLPSLLLLTILVFPITTAAASSQPLAPRRVIVLDGKWQIDEGTLETAPQRFTHEVPVPGLVDMAEPAFAEVGKKSALRRAFWYRRSLVVDGPIPARAILKIHKARYGTKVFLNGQVVGEHLPCFTPAYLDLKPWLKGNGQANELVIRVGADRESLPPGVPTGWDFEKYRFIPGIYDSVELILTGSPYIQNVQAVPDIAAKAVRLVVEVAVDGPADVTLKVAVAEARTGAEVGWTAVAGAKPGTIAFDVPIAGCHLWSPEDPFLYEARLSTGSDAVKIRFGMRSFTFDPASKRAVLNGRPYFMRGTNVCIYRFFEDQQRADRPWRAEWVRRLHQTFKTMHWNSIRYCIGFPPENWYDIADEEGFLIQDEFPIWLLGGAPEHPQAEKIIPQYEEWMRERWNHPCVVIWDAQNESATHETDKAVRAVRHLDLSGRPWENGWSEPQAEHDCVESHPYLFIRVWAGQKPFRLKELEHVSGVPALNQEQKKRAVPIIINEYCWLWLNRDGSPTCLTDKVYESILGPHSTLPQRRQMHARYVAALTEFWRCHREAAAVMQFCGLGYSRAGDKPRPEGGATSDHFVDLEKLTLEPLIAKYVGEAFNPQGLMLDFWAETLPCGQPRDVQVYVINDLDEDWQGDVRLRVVKSASAAVLATTGSATDAKLAPAATPARDEWPLPMQSRSCKVAAFGREIVSLTAAVPAEPGDYTLVAEIVDRSGKAIHSLRDFKAVRGK
jgi:hypothetical protein